MIDKLPGDGYFLPGTQNFKPVELVNPNRKCLYLLIAKRLIFCSHSADILHVNILNQKAESWRKNPTQWKPSASKKATGNKKESQKYDVSIVLLVTSQVARSLT